MASAAGRTWQPQPMLDGLDIPAAAGAAAAAGLDGAEAKPHHARIRRLSVREVSRWARTQATRIARETHTDRSSDVFAYAQAAKLVEEVGELHAELLGRSKRQRTGKQRQYTDDTLAAELADVVLATALLAEIVGVDLSDAVTSKIAVIDARTRAAPLTP